jgi:hypothetical protein
MTDVSKSNVTMENETENKPSFLSEAEKIGWDYYISIRVKGADDLRKELGRDELNFRRVSPTANQQPKKYFIYRVLDEIQKAALKIAYWKEYLAEEEPSSLQRIDYETIVDDQHFRARKLAETLVDSILFSTTDDQAYYADYFLLYELNELARAQEAAAQHLVRVLICTGVLVPGMVKSGNKMKKSFARFFALSFLLIPNFALARSGPGHLAIAAEGYRELSPELKAGSLDALKAHPV